MPVFPNNWYLSSWFDSGREGGSQGCVKAIRVTQDVLGM
ncbi:hypothetical protein A2U01_0073508, partial [Trifolium medium]|nr:hypothetical protein [Trifolium medium]